MKCYIDSDKPAALNIDKPALIQSKYDENTAEENCDN